MQRFQMGGLDPVPPGQLLHEEMRIAPQQDVGRAELGGPPEPLTRRRVFRDVVGRLTDPLRDRVDHVALGRGDHDADAGGSGVPPRRAVAGDDHAKITIRRQYSHLLTPSIRFSLSSSIAESFS